MKVGDIMKIERISENKLKITLAGEDLEKWNLDIDDLSYNTPKVQEMFWSVVKKAENETEFFTEDSQLIIEAMTSSKEGFVIFITKVDEQEALVPIHKQLSKHLSGNFDEADIQETEEEVLPYNMYMFDKFNDVCLVSNRINHLFKGTSSVKKYKDKYFLYLYYDDICEEEELLIDALVSEYGTLIDNPIVFDGYIVEYGHSIIENNAISILKDYCSE